MSNISLRQRRTRKEPLIYTRCNGKAGSAPRAAGTVRLYVGQSDWEEINDARARRNFDWPTTASESPWTSVDVSRRIP